jgi:hypothetical protein
MNEDSKQTRQTWNSEHSQRACKLSERGAHYFVGWLIGAGMDKPEIAEVFEEVLAKMETDPTLRYCWRDGASMDAVATPPEQVTFSVHTEQPVATGEVVPGPAESGAIDEHGRTGVIQMEAKSERAGGPSGSFFGKLFRRQRIAA